MTNGKIVFGSTSYVFPENYQWEYPRKLVENRIVDYTTTGDPVITHLFALYEFDLSFVLISDAQKAVLDAAGIYPGTVTFYPDGEDGESYTGLWTVSDSVHIQVDQNNVVCRFVGKKNS